MKQLLFIITLVAVCVSGVAAVAYFAGRTYDGLDERVRNEVILKRAETALLREKVQFIRTQAQAQANLLALKNAARVDNAPQVVKARIVTRTMTALWLPLALLASAAVGAGYLCHAAIRRVEFAAAGVSTFVTRHQAAALAEKALLLQGVTEQARIAAFTETLGQQRFTQATGLFAALGRAWRFGAQAALPASPEPEQIAPAPQQVLSFREALQAGKFEKGMPLLFGFTQDGRALTGTWRDCYSLGVSGLSGYGKTSTLRAIVSESLLTGAVEKCYVLDPHYPHPDSLLTGFGELRDAPQMASASSKAEMPRLINEVNREIDDRLAGRKPSEPVSVVVIDEVMAAVKLAGVAELIERIGTESRKAGVYGVFASQSWNGEKTGGTTARDNLTALLVHRMKRKQAQTLLQDTDLTRQVTRLDIGQALFVPTTGEPQVLTVPFCSREDMSVVVSKLRGVAQPQAARDAQDGGASVSASNEVDASQGRVERENAIPFDAAAWRDNAVTGDASVTADETGRDRPETAGVTDVDALLARVRGCIQTGVSVADVSRATRIDRSLLTNILRGKRRASASVTAALKTYIEGA